jgi:hypothetical protein
MLASCNVRENLRCDDASGGGGRTLRAERRRIGGAWRALVTRRNKKFDMLRRDDRRRRIRRASGERGERIAQQPAVGLPVVVRVAAVEMDELAVLVDVLDRVLERRLPAGKQRDNEKKST